MSSANGTIHETTEKTDAISLKEELLILASRIRAAIEAAGVVEVAHLEDANHGIRLTTQSTPITPIGFQQSIFAVLTFAMDDAEQ